MLRLDMRLTDEEWLRIEPLLPPENTGKQGRQGKTIVSYE